MLTLLAVVALVWAVFMTIGFVLEYVVPLVCMPLGFITSRPVTSLRGRRRNDHHHPVIGAEGPPEPGLTGQSRRFTCRWFGDQVQWGERSTHHDSNEG